jgi:ABC-2 type transport system permease protein
VLKRRRSTPVPAWVMIASRALAAAVLAVILVVVVVVIGRLAYGVHLPSSTIPACALGVAVGAASFCCMAFAVSSFIRSEDSAQPIIQATVLPLYFISGVFVPTSQLSKTLREVASVFPISHLDRALFKAFDPATTGSGISARDLVILGSWGVAGLVVALLRFSWSPRGA